MSIKILSLLLLVLLFFVITACDPYSHGYICNNRNQDIELILNFDYKETDNWTKKQYLNWILEEFDSNMSLIDFDTTLMTGWYKIQNNRCALVGHGMEGYPPFMFNELTILTQTDTTTYKNLDTDRTLFKKRDKGFQIGFGGNYEMKIN